MKKLPVRELLLCCGLLLCGYTYGGIAMIGHANLPRLDEGTVQKLYTGKLIELGGINIVAVNAPSGSLIRTRFLRVFLNQDEDKYTAYWTVRRHIGKGNPPHELASSTEVINFVQATPGAIGYVDETDLKPGLSVLARKTDAK